MNDAQKEKQKANLVKLNLMAEADTLIDCLQASCYEKLFGFLGNWRQGWIYFTDKAVVYPGGLGSDHIVIPYSSITGVSPCRQWIFPMGIAVTYTDAARGEVVRKFSIYKRDKWISFLEERRGK